MRIQQILLLLLTAVILPTTQAEKPSISFSETANPSNKTIYKPKVFESSSSKKTPSYTLPRQTAPMVEIYYAAWDPHSQEALKFFRKYHIIVTAYDISADAEAAARKKKLAPDFAGIPLVIINGIVIRGVDEQKYQDALHPIKPPEYK